MADSYAEFPNILTGDQMPLRLRTIDNGDGTKSLAMGAPSGASANQVQGTTAAGAASTGNPVYMGGIYKASPGVVADGQRTAFLTDEYGQLKVVTLGTNTVGGTAADAAAASGSPVDVAGEYLAVAPTLTNGSHKRLQVDVNGYLRSREMYAPLYEDNVNQVAKIEQRFTPSAVLLTDTVVKNGAGFIHTVTFSCNDAAPTAGTIDIYDGTSAVGNKIFTHNFTTTPFMPFSILLDVECAIGIFVDFTTTADVAVVVSKR